MRIEYTGRQTEVAPEIRTLAERKLKKLFRSLPGIIHVHVIIESDKHRQIAEVTVQSRNLTLTATEETDDQGVSVATVIDKLTRQAQKHVGKRREGKRRTSPRSTALWSGVLTPSPEGDGGSRILRSRRFVVKPMTVDEAALEVDSAEEGFVVFRDAATEKVNVLFRRKDGNLGLIEPEA